MSPSFATELAASSTVSAGRWTAWGSPVVSDALRKLGKAFQSLEGGFSAVDPSSRIAGPAFTVRCYPGATWALEQALELAAPGEVLMVDAGGRPDVIAMGALMSQRAKVRGLAGAVIDGAVRDVGEIRAVGFPVFSRYVCPRAGTHAEIGEWQTTICCGRTPVSPGDWIVADESGVVVIPSDSVESVAFEAAKIAEFEHRFASALEVGLPLAEAANLARQ
jgi:regulator of RNase E activity RraA